MKKKADRIDKMDKIRVSRGGLTEVLTLAKTVSHKPFDSLDDHSMGEEFVFETPCRRDRELVSSIL
jgi:hypothetical protein